MKIIWEPLDYAEVEDDMAAGEAAACEVQLLSKVGEGVWKVEILPSQFTEGGTITTVLESFLRPR
jgi:hypothetical protein